MRCIAHESYPPVVIVPGDRCPVINSADVDVSPIGNPRSHRTIRLTERCGCFSERGQPGLTIWIVLDIPFPRSAEDERPSSRVIFIEYILDYNMIRGMYVMGLDIDVNIRAIIINDPAG